MPCGNPSIAASGARALYVLLNPTNCGIPIAPAAPQVIPYVSPYANKTWNKAVRAAAPNQAATPQCYPNPQ
jgi:hypothetical protein